MKLSRRTNTIILWIVSIGLLLGMIITFTPTMGLGGGGATPQRATALTVNGEPITELEVERARQGALFNRVSEGQVAEDLELLLVDGLVRQEVFDQAAARTRVSRAEVREQVQEFREASGVGGRGNDRAYLQLIGQSGFDDASFRAYIEEQLRRGKYEESLLEGVEVSDEEVRTFYEANADAYQSEERILARSIVVEERELAQELADRAEAGEDFAQLASEYSIERADRGGALGAPSGSSEPQPVSRAALPQAAAAAAFGLGGPGVTEPVQAAGNWHVVKVEEVIPAQTRPFEEVADQVREDALEAKQAGVVQRHVDELVANATVNIPANSDLSYDDYPVARVGDQEIMATELVRTTYSNQQIQQSLSPELAPLVVEFFKPSILETMIDRKLAFLGSSELDADFVGGEGQVAQQALAYVSRDVDISEEEIAEYYETNLSRFTVPAQAETTKVEFGSEEAAEAFRSSLLDGSDLESAAEESEGTVEELGTVFEGQLDEALDMALFGTDAFEELPESDEEVSDVLVIEEQVEPTDEQTEPTDEQADAEGEGEAAADAAEEDGATAADAAEEDGTSEAAAQEPVMQETYVVLVANRIAERVRPLDEVRNQVVQAVRQMKRAELQNEWVDGLREEYQVENLLAQAQAEEAAEGADASGAAATDPAVGDDPAATSEPSAEGESTGADVEEDAAAADDSGDTGTGGTGDGESANGDSADGEETSDGE